MIATLLSLLQIIAYTVMLRRLKMNRCQENERKTDWGNPRNILQVVQEGIINANLSNSA